jgi:myo-inositol 2-dehydrogenase/D-chiro-inositol 1-dehydrogenase
MPPDVELGIGMVGTGYMARRHLEEVASHPWARLQVICSTERSASEGASLRDHYGIARATTALEDLLHDPLVDVVFLCSPDAAHAGQVIRALEAQKHVFCEKPLARNARDFAAIAALLGENNRVLQVGMNCRFRAAHRAVKDTVEGQVHGPLRFFRGTYVQNAVSTVRMNVKPWILDAPPDANQFLHGGGLHCLDLMRWIGGPVTSVFARATGFELGDVWRSDTFSISLEFANGAPGELLVSASAFRPNVFALEAWLENGSIADGALNVRDGDELGRSSPLKVHQEKSDLVLQFEDLASAVADDRAPLNSFDEAFNNFVVLRAAEHSAETGQAVVPESIPTVGR